MPVPEPKLSWIQSPGRRDTHTVSLNSICYDNKIFLETICIFTTLFIKEQKFCGLLQVKLFQKFFSRILSIKKQRRISFASDQRV